MELTDEEKQQVINFRNWVKARPELAAIFHSNVKARTAITISRFQKFHLQREVLSEITEYGNEELLYGYYLRDTLQGRV